MLVKTPSNKQVNSRVNRVSMVTRDEKKCHELPNSSATISHSFLDDHVSYFPQKLMSVIPHVSEI